MKQAELIPQDQAEIKKQEAQRSLPLAAVKASMTGNWNGVTDMDRVKFIKHMCDSLSIDLVLNPFRFIDMRGKTVLYATAEAAFSLARKNKLTVQIIEEKFNKDTMILTTHVRAKFPNGTFTDDVGKLFIGGLSRQDRANAEMKCITKGKRRAILSSLGLSILDESELEEAKEQHHDATEYNQAEPVKGTDEDQEFRERLFDFAVDESGPFPGDAKALEAHIKSKTGKDLMSLNASECEDLLSELNNDDPFGMNEPSEP